MAIKKIWDQELNDKDERLAEMLAPTECPNSYECRVNGGDCLACWRRYLAENPAD